MIHYYEGVSQKWPITITWLFVTLHKSHSEVPASRQKGRGWYWRVFRSRVQRDARFWKKNNYLWGEGWGHVKNASCTWAWWVSRVRHVACDLGLLKRLHWHFIKLLSLITDHIHIPENKDCKCLENTNYECPIYVHNVLLLL